MKEGFVLRRKEFSQGWLNKNNVVASVAFKNYSKAKVERDEKYLRDKSLDFFLNNYCK